MSFFAQTQRKTKLQKVGVPSPGNYNPVNLSDSRKYSCAPFGSTQRLNRSNFKQRGKDQQKKQKADDIHQELKELDAHLKKQQQISSMFKSETCRFRNENIQIIPGPGQYNVDNKKNQQSKSHKVISRDYHLSIKPSVPSIPIDNLGFREDQNNQMKKVQAPKYATPDAGTYQVNKQTVSKGVVPWKAEKLVNRMSDYAPGPGQYSYQVKSNKSLSSCFTSNTDRFGVIKKLKHDKIPGPGAYNAQPMKKLSHNISSQGYFNSKRSRFQNNSHNQSIGPGAYFNEKKKSQSVNQLRRIVDKEPQIINKPPPMKVSIFQSKNKNPGPGQYKTNYGISYQLHKALIKKQTTDILPKEKRNVFQAKPDDEMPGPGTYENPSKSNPKTKGKLWKKTEVVNLKEQPQITPSPMDYNNLQHTIQAKIKQMNSKLTLTEEKPFNCGTQRFKHYTMRKPQQDEEQQMEKIESQQTEADLGRYHQKKKVKRLIMTTIKVRVPFGISSTKFQQKAEPYYGPDFYDKSKDWLKPSFNIKSKLQ